MKILKSTKQKGLQAVLTFIIIMLGLNISAQNYYQLKIYNIKNQTQETQIDNYLQQDYLPALHRAGIKDVGVFKPIESSEDAGKKVIVFIPLKKLNQLEKLNTELEKDEKFQAAGKNFINAAWDNPPFERMESIVLKAFSEMPKYSVPNHSTPASERIYELRSYEGPTDMKYHKKVEMFNKGGEVELFKNLEFQPVFFAEVISGSAMPNLMYLTTFSDMESHDKHWDAFRNHPDWKKLSGMKEYEHTVSHADILLLHPADYSDI